MANERRIRWLRAPVLVLDAAYDPSTDTTISAPQLASYPVVGATNHLAIIVDYDRVTGEPFPLYITAHSSGATTATVAKDVEDSTATAVPSGTKAIHGHTVRDFPRIGRGVYTGADITLSSQANGGAIINAALAASVEAYEGDIAMIRTAGRVGSEAVDTLFDVRISTGSTGYVGVGLGSGVGGIGGWQANSGVVTGLSFFKSFVVAAAHLTSNGLTVQWYYKNGSATTRTFTVAGGGGYKPEILVEVMPDYVAPTF